MNANTSTPPTMPMCKTVVLFADDAASVRFLVRTTLEGAGYEAIETADGQEALDVLASDRVVDLLITDLHMPGVDGLELVRKTRALASRRYLPIVMLTTESQTDRVQEGIKAGLTAWIVKPFRSDTLIKVASKALGNKRLPPIAAQQRSAPK
jgi:two-component system, chemotaxis family, chemotaxis protein CheY